MTLGTRFILLVGSLVAAYFAVWIGDSMTTASSTSERADVRGIAGLFYLGLTLVSIGLIIQAFREKLWDTASLKTGQLPAPHLALRNLINSLDALC